MFKLTDGIIQNIFNKYIAYKQLDSEPNTSYDKNDVLEFTKHIQNTLIETINHEFNFIFDAESCNEAHHEHNYNLYAKGQQIKKFLIGDTI